MALICDTGPLFAAMDRDDRDHKACARLLSETSEQVVIPSPVLAEVDWLAGQRLKPDAFLNLLADIGAGTIGIAELELEDYGRVHELVDRYRDLPLGFVDAAVLTIVERLGESKLATLDRRHFSVVRPRHLPALRLIP
jgi:predicted nucleic acid-binding protein